VRATRAGSYRALLLLALIAPLHSGCGAGDIMKPSPPATAATKAPSHTDPGVALRLSVSLTPPGLVVLRIFDVEGHPVRIITKTVEAGCQEITWDGRNDARFPVGSSVYVYQLVLPNGEVTVGRLVLAR